MIEILTHDTMQGVLKDTAFFGNGGVQSNSVLPLGSAEIFYGGQIIAVVLANSFEAAREGAYLIDVAYQDAEPAATFGSAGASSQALAEANKKHEDPEIGHFDTAYQAADVRVDAHYATPTQHHNPIELFTTTCVWSGPQLTVYEPSQNVFGIKNGIAQQLGIDASQVRVVSPPRGRCLRLEGRTDAAYRAGRGGGTAIESAGKARSDPSPGVHHRDLPGRDGTSRKARGFARWPATGAIA